MGKTTIEWTDASWNPIVGCTEVSPGCANCYAARFTSTRLRKTPQYCNLAVVHGSMKAAMQVGDHPLVLKPRWTGEVRFLPERLEEPLHWKKPRRIFVCDMGDLFHESVQDDWIVRVFSVILSTHQHTYQILTKRAERMKAWITKHTPILLQAATEVRPMPLPNVWLGVSVENQHFADERIPRLLETPAAVRWISAEPLLGPINLNRSGIGPKMPNDAAGWLHWVVCGGESGPQGRPMHHDWARSLRDQCQAAGVPFFFKQWGEFLPAGQDGRPSDSTHTQRLNCSD